MGAEVAVITEVAPDGAHSVARELIAFAKALPRDKASPLRVFIPGNGGGAAAAELARLPDVSVTRIEGPDFEGYSAEAWKMALTPLLAALKPRFICVAHTANGADFAPGLAVRLEAACITAVEALRLEGPAPVFSRSILKGKLRMEIVPEAETAVITLLPGAFPPVDAPADLRTDAPAAEVVWVPEMTLRTRSLGPLAAPEAPADLASAEVIVAAGRGIGGEETLALLRHLAACFSHSAVGASRAACDMGWLPHAFQIGQTGATVAPRLYIACGISGAQQHLAGMRGSQCVAAINRDPQAAIFREADLAVVEDLVGFLPLLIAACHGERTSPREDR